MTKVPCAEAARSVGTTSRRKRISPMWASAKEPACITCSSSVGKSGRSSENSSQRRQPITAAAAISFSGDTARNTRPASANRMISAMTPIAQKMPMVKSEKPLARQMIVPKL